MRVSGLSAFEEFACLFFLLQRICSKCCFHPRANFLLFFVRTSVYHHVELPALGQPRRCLLLDALASSSLRKDVPAYVLAPDGRRVLGSVCRLTNRFWLTMLGRGFLDQTSLSRTVAYQSFQIIPRPPPGTEVLMFRRGLPDDSSFSTKMVYKPFEIILSARSQSWMAMFRRGFLGDPSLSTAAACKSFKNTPNYLTQMDDVSSTAHLCP